MCKRIFILDKNLTEFPVFSVIYWENSEIHFEFLLKAESWMNH